MIERDSERARGEHTDLSSRCPCPVCVMPWCLSDYKLVAHTITAGNLFIGKTSGLTAVWRSGNVILIV